jgi:hypothetical protein
MELKKCPYCGKSILAIAKVCKHCGKSLAPQEESTSKQETVIEKPTVQNNYEQPSVYNQQPTTTVKPKKVQWWLWLIFGLLTLLVPVVGILGLIVLIILTVYWKKGGTQQTVAPQRPPYVNKPVSTIVKPAAKAYNNAAEAKVYFRNILNTEFSQYQIRENVPVSEIRGAEIAIQEKFWKDMPMKQYYTTEGRAYDFGLYVGGILKAVVSLGEDSSHDSKKEYLISRMYAKKANIPYINFYTQFPNKKEYVVDRIKKMLI